MLECENNPYPTCTQQKGSHVQTPRQQHDQRVPFNMTGHRRAVGKEKHTPTTLVAASSNCSLQKESLNDKGYQESKRSTAQILALFSSSKNMPQLQISDTGESVIANQASIAVKGKSCLDRQHLDGATNSNLTPKDTVKLDADTNSNSRTAFPLQPKVEEINFVEEDLIMSEDLFDSIRLSPVSFAACSDETTCTSFQGVDPQGSQTRDVTEEGDTQESPVSKSSYDSERQNNLWSQNDSESVSPLMRNRTSGDKDCPQAHADFKDEQERLYNNVTTGLSKMDHYSIQNHDSALYPSLNLFSIQQSPYVFQTSVKTFCDPDLVQASPLSQPNLLSPRPDSDARSTKAAAKDAFTGYKNRPDTQARENQFSTETQGFSRHPGSLFECSALQGQEQTNPLERSSDSSTYEEGLGSLELWNTPLESTDPEDIEEVFLVSGLSPEMFPSQRGKITQWRASPVVTTRVIPSVSRTVSLSTCQYCFVASRYPLCICG